MDEKGYLNVEELKAAYMEGKKVEFTKEFISICKENGWTDGLSQEPPFDVLTCKSIDDSPNLSIEYKDAEERTWDFRMKPAGWGKVNGIGVFKLYEETYDEASAEASVKKTIDNNQQQKTEESKMSSKLMNGLKTLSEAGTEGAKTGTGAITTEEIVNLFHKHFGNKLPGWWGLIPYVKDAEATLLPGLVYLGTLFTDNKYAKKLQKPTLYAFQGKVHDLTKDVWQIIRPFIVDLYALVVSRGLLPEEDGAE